MEADLAWFEMDTKGKQAIAHTAAVHAREQTLKEVIRLVTETIAAEPQLPRDMPDELWTMLSDKESTTEAMRIVVKTTQRSIMERFLDGLAALKAGK